MGHGTGRDPSLEALVRLVGATMHFRMAVTRIGELASASLHYERKLVDEGLPKSIQAFDSQLYLDWTSLVDDSASFFPAVPVDRSKLKIASDHLVLYRNIALRASISVGDKSSVAVRRALRSQVRRGLEQDCSLDHELGSSTGKVFCSIKDSGGLSIAGQEQLLLSMQSPEHLVPSLSIRDASLEALDIKLEGNSDLSISGISSIRLPDGARKFFEFAASDGVGKWQESFVLALAESLRQSSWKLNGLSVHPELVILDPPSDIGSAVVRVLASDHSTSDRPIVFELKYVVADGALTRTSKRELPLHTLVAHLFGLDHVIEQMRLSRDGSGLASDHFDKSWALAAIAKEFELASPEIDSLRALLGGSTGESLAYCDVLNLNAFELLSAAGITRICARERFGRSPLRKKDLEHAVKIKTQETRQVVAAQYVSLGLTDDYALSEDFIRSLHSSSLSGEHLRQAFAKDPTVSANRTVHLDTVIADALLNRDDLVDLIPDLVDRPSCDAGGNCDFSITRRWPITRAWNWLWAEHLNNLATERVAAWDKRRTTAPVLNLSAFENWCSDKTVNQSFTASVDLSFQLTCKDGLPSGVSRVRLQPSPAALPIPASAIQDSVLVWPDYYNALMEAFASSSSPRLRKIGAPMCLAPDCTPLPENLIKREVRWYVTEVLTRLKPDTDRVRMVKAVDAVVSDFSDRIYKSVLIRDLDAFTLLVAGEVACRKKISLCPEVVIDNKGEIKELAWDVGGGLEARFVLRGYRKDGFRALPSDHQVRNPFEKKGRLDEGQRKPWTFDASLFSTAAAQETELNKKPCVLFEIEKPAVLRTCAVEYLLSVLGMYEGFSVRKWTEVDSLEAAGSEIMRRRVSIIEKTHAAGSSSPFQVKRIVAKDCTHNDSDICVSILGRREADTADISFEVLGRKFYGPADRLVQSICDQFDPDTGFSCAKKANRICQCKQDTF